MQPNANILSKAKVQRSPGWPGLGFAINQFAWENARLGKIARRPLLQIRDICPTLLSIENHVLVGKWQGGSKPLRLRQQVGGISQQSSVALWEKRLWISEAAFCARARKGLACWGGRQSGG